MEFRNLLNFILSLIVVFSLIVFVPFIRNVIAIFSLVFFGIKLAEWLMKITRKFILYKKVAPKGKAVLITGCGSGFGNALARRMDVLGYSVFAACHNIDNESAKKLTEDCSDKLTVLPLDITDEQSILNAKTFVETNLKDNVLWTVVNNAGVLKCGQIDWTSVEEVQEVCSVNILGALRVMKAFLPLIKISKGRIVNVTSGSGRYIIPGALPYSMSKSCAITLTSGLQIELRKWGIKCINIEPFLYETKLGGRQNMFAEAEKTWNAAPAEVKEEYGEAYFKAFKSTIDRFISLLSSSKISEVVDCMEDAITAEDPLSIYVPANFFRHKITMLLYNALPLNIKEYLFSYILESGSKPLTLLLNKKKKERRTIRQMKKKH